MFGSERPEKDGVAAGNSQAVGKCRDDGARDALPAGRRQCEQVLNHADTIGRSRVGGIGDWNAILRRKIEMISTALGAVASHYVGTNLRRYLGIAGALPLGMIGEHQPKQCVPVAAVDDGSQLDWWTAIGEITLQSHLDGDGTLFEIVEGKPGEKRLGREAIGMDHTPRSVTKVSIHRSKYSVDLGIGSSRDIIGMV